MKNNILNQKTDNFSEKKLDWSIIQSEIKNCLNLNKSEKNKRETASSALLIKTPPKKKLFLTKLLL